MSWDTVENQHKLKFDHGYVSCHEPYERKYIVTLIINSFPQFRKSIVERAIDLACLSMVTPRYRGEFFVRIKDILGKKSELAENPRKSRHQFFIANGKHL